MNRADAQKQLWADYNEAIDEEINPLHGDCIELPSRADALQAFVGSGDTPLSDNC